MTSWKCPRCPQCDSEPVLALPLQAFCGNEECGAVCWNPTISLDENLMNANFIDLPDWLRPVDGMASGADKQGKDDQDQADHDVALDDRDGAHDAQDDGGKEKESGKHG